MRKPLPAKKIDTAPINPCTAYADLDRIQCTNEATHISDDSPGAHCSWHIYMLKGHVEKI